MARVTKQHPQAVAPYLTQHSADPEWPVVMIVDERGQSRHACADCGGEIPDGVCVERVKGGVVAYSVSREHDPEAQEHAGTDIRGNLYVHRPLRERERTVHHDCSGVSGG